MNSLRKNQEAHGWGVGEITAKQGDVLEGADEVSHRTGFFMAR